MLENKIPNHVAIILDGNRRWAAEHKLPKLEGHKKGAENIRTMAKYIFSKGVGYLSVFVFSTENFKRTSEEVKYLMDLFINEFKEKFEELHQNNIKIIFSGKKDNLRTDVLEVMNYLTEKTKDNTGGTLNICLNYGGQQEIVDTTKKLIELVDNNKLKLNDIDENVFQQNLYQNLPNIDLLIRTGGDMRVSNFMLWQMSYAEMYFPKVYWPAFDEEEFDKALDVFNGRERRFGGDSK